MFVYASKTFTAAQVGQKLQKVVCDKCKQIYFYELVRIGAGSATAPYLIGMNKARQRAEDRAGADLGDRLYGDAELVPCPKCNWVNQQLVDRYRQRMYSRAWKLILA